MPHGEVTLPLEMGSYSKMSSSHRKRRYLRQIATPEGRYILNWVIAPVRRFAGWQYRTTTDPEGR